MLRVAFTTNEPRSQMLLAELARQAKIAVEIDFDQIDGFTKYAAALLTYRSPRSEWWSAYQMHPLLQRRRRVVLAQSLRPHLAQLDALLMWGSWFHPFRGTAASLPYFTYIDQSHSLTPSHGEPAVSLRGQAKAHGLQAETYRDASGVLCMSEWAREQTAAAHELPDSKLHVVGWGPCAVDLSGEELSDAHREPLVLHVSSSFRRKGVDFLIDAARRVRQSEPQLKFVVVGGDVERMAVRDTEDVRFVGPITDRAVLADYFRRAAIFFLPHRFDRSPHVLAEAMSAGLPIVTSAQGGAVELVHGNDAGLCIPIGDVRGYSEAILSLWRDAAMRQRMAANGRDAVRRQYNWHSVAANILRIMTEAVDAERPPAVGMRSTPSVANAS
jgi:glycosyltransferase involved in cell wall biosynthesis